MSNENQYVIDLDTVLTQLWATYDPFKTYETANKLSRLLSGMAMVYFIQGLKADRETIDDLNDVVRFIKWNWSYCANNWRNSTARIA